MKKLWIVLVLVVMPGCGAEFANGHDPMPEAQNYCKTMYPDAERVLTVPAGQDSDLDGYTSVTARIVYRDGHDMMISLNCGSGFGYRGCKLK